MHQCFQIERPCKYKDRIEDLFYNSGWIHQIFGPVEEYNGHYIKNKNQTKTREWDCSQYVAVHGISILTISQ